MLAPTPILCAQQDGDAGEAHPGDVRSGSAAGRVVQVCLVVVTAIVNLHELVTTVGTRSNTLCTAGTAGWSSQSGPARLRVLGLCCRQRCAGVSGRGRSSGRSNSEFT